EGKRLPFHGRAVGFRGHRTGFKKGARIDVSLCIQRAYMIIAAGHKVTITWQLPCNQVIPKDREVVTLSEMGRESPRRIMRLDENVEEVIPQQEYAGWVPGLSPATQT